MKLTNNFSLQEFIPSGIYKKWGDHSIWYIDDRLPHLAQFFRDRFQKPIMINTWHYIDIAGTNYRGYRPANCHVGASKSQHKFGRAIDISIEDFDLAAVYADIIKHKKLYFDQGLRGLEDFKKTKSWIHLDMRNSQSDEIFIF